MSRDRLHWFGLAGSALTVALVALTFRGCLSRRDGDSPPRENTCTACHGSAAREGDAVQRAAPPVDLAGNTDVSARGVGAHQFHLNAGATHAAVPCAECHVVPDAVASPGHADSELPAELSFGTLARVGGRTPSYDPNSGGCSDTYCHREATMKWTAPRASDAACGSCHGLPPPSPHPQIAECSRCHGDVVAADGSFKRPDLHVNGTVDVVGLNCSSCHGSESSPAPPLDLLGNSEPTAVGVGAHQVHLAGGLNSRAVACGDCHVVPPMISSPGHLDSTPGAEVPFAGVALAGGAVPTWNSGELSCSGTWCHGPTAPATSVSPKWTSVGTPLSCTGCHGTPPPAPHPQMARCSLCHSTVGADNSTIVKRDQHVNGVVDVVVPQECNACHGSTQSPAPPKDLAGNQSTSAVGVGAHQAHLDASPYFRTVQCGECHVVPQNVLDLGHLDSAGPAELAFSGVSITGGAKPQFDGVSCTASYCHGASFPQGNPSGGNNTAPSWTAVGAGQIACDSCHGLPPPAPHPQIATDCWLCHTNITPSFSFKDPSLHVDGVVQ